jgi:hypothetical protein
MSTSDLIVYEDKIRMLFSVPDAFGSRPHPVSAWIWKPDIDAGAVISGGAPLADIQWEDNATDEVFAPAACSGTIQWINRDIDTVHLSLPFAGPQRLLTLG